MMHAEEGLILSGKYEIRSTKPETNTNDRNINDQK
jgi:hypothetical protein